MQPIEELAAHLNAAVRQRPRAARILATLGLASLAAWLGLGALDWWEGFWRLRSLAASVEAPTWTVKKGETLYQIAKRQHVTVADLRTWNGIKGDRIEIGQVLRTGPQPEVNTTALSAARLPRYRKQRAMALALAMLAFATSAAARLQTVARQRVIQIYLVEEPTGEALSELLAGLESLRACARLWRIASEVPHLVNYKWTGGAITRVARLEGGVLVGGPRQLRCNIEVFGLTGIGMNLYFLPDGVLVHWPHQDQFIGLTYRTLGVVSRKTQMNEDGGTPSDARQVGVTWMRMNVDGSPDMRFKDNYQIPICEYGELKIRGADIGEQVWRTSRPDAPFGFARAWPKLAGFVATPLQRRSAPILPPPPPVEPDESILDTPTIP